MIYRHVFEQRDLVTARNWYVADRFWKNFTEIELFLCLDKLHTEMRRKLIRGYIRKWTILLRYSRKETLFSRVLYWKSSSSRQVQMPLDSSRVSGAGTVRNCWKASTERLPPIMGRTGLYFLV